MESRYIYLHTTCSFVAPRLIDCRCPVNSLSTYSTPTSLPRSLGIATTDGGAAVQVFFFDGVKMQQVRYAKTKWTTGEIGAGVPEASMANGPLGTVGWNDTSVRMYYPTGEGRKIKEVAESGSAWKVGSGWEDEYD